MTDLPETLNMTLIIEPSLASAGMASEVVSTIGFGVAGLTGPPPILEPGDVVTGAPGSPVIVALTPIGYGLYTLDFSIPAGYDGVGVQSAAINGAGHLIITLTNGVPIDAGQAKGADGLGTFNGPATAIDGHVVLFDGITGKLGKDGGALGTAAFQAIAAFATAAQGVKADSAVQPAGLTKAAVGLGNADNTSDVNKPVSTAQAAADALKLAVTSKGTAAQIRAGTDNTNYLTALALAGATAISSTTGSGTWNPNFATDGTPKRVANGISTLGAPTGGIEGRTYAIILQQDATGSRAWSFASNYDFGSAGTPSPSTGANRVDIVFATCLDATTQSYRASFSKAA